VLHVVPPAPPPPLLPLRPLDAFLLGQEAVRSEAGFLTSRRVRGEGGLVGSSRVEFRGNEGSEFGEFSEARRGSGKIVISLFLLRKPQTSYGTCCADAMTTWGDGTPPPAVVRCGPVVPQHFRHALKHLLTIT
jgi:hypothetical protein